MSKGKEHTAMQLAIEGLYKITRCTIRDDADLDDQDDLYVRLVDIEKILQQLVLVEREQQRHAYETVPRATLIHESGVVTQRKSHFSKWFSKKYGSDE